MTNYNDSKKPRTNKHREELLLELDSLQWETFHGDDRSDNHKRSHVITLDPTGLAYLALLDSEIASNDLIPSDIKIMLATYLRFYFARTEHWQTSQRGRKKGYFGNLSLGYIMHTQDSKLHMGVQFYRRLKEENCYIFRIDINGQGFDKVNGYIFLRQNGTIYQLTDDRISDLQEIM